MISQKTKQAKQRNLIEPSTIKLVNVKELDPKQRRGLFIDCLNKNGFTGFVKYKENNQTCYIFTYKNPFWA